MHSCVIRTRTLTGKLRRNVSLAVYYAPVLHHPIAETALQGGSV